MVAIVWTLKKKPSSSEPERALAMEPGLAAYARANTAFARTNATATARKNCHHLSVRTRWYRSSTGERERPSVRSRTIELAGLEGRGGDIVGILQASRRDEGAI